MDTIRNHTFHDFPPSLSLSLSHAQGDRHSPLFFSSDSCKIMKRDL
ncbi:hypothetical protein NC653_040440 [Populus alba x Populus x berolinensis]|uniref:Uncharacterized protein n=1 Tax=Populus alba x Populus x berolinensis TaxID=444605 RepID=A0AAD6LDU0_9ROSI|nr:hypothetical protein NC653_040440 [Populus alba x Populus x berolinensis]